MYWTSRKRYIHVGVAAVGFADRAEADQLSARDDGAGECYARRAGVAVVGPLFRLVGAAAVAVSLLV